MEFFREIELSIAKILLAGIVILLLLGGLLRFVGYPIIWSLEIAQVMFAWTAVLSIDYCLQIRRHIGVEEVLRKFPVKIQKILIILNELFILAFLICGVYYGFKMIFATSNAQLPTTGLPKWVLDSAVPVACLLMIVSSISYIYTDLFDAPVKTNTLNAYEANFQNDKDIV
jgi:TRAP-type C4-dicarboxylate transport system permease small subunit